MYINSNIKNFVYIMATISKYAHKFKNALCEILKC